MKFTTRNRDRKGGHNSLSYSVYEYLLNFLTDKSFTVYNSAVERKLQKKIKRKQNRKYKIEEEYYHES